MVESSALLNPSLQYGAFAILLASIVGFVIIQRDRDKKVEHRLSQTDEFIRKLVERTMAAQDAQITAYQSLTREAITAQQETVSVLGQISRQIDDNGKQNTERHQAIMRRLDREPINAGSIGK